LDWSAQEALTITMTLSYDYAILQFWYNISVCVFAYEKPPIFWGFFIFMVAFS
jgi:hypothetical protein